MISLTNESIINDLTFICRNLEKPTMTSPSGRIYSIEQVDRQRDSYVPHVDIGIHCAPLKCRTSQPCLVFVSSNFYRVKHLSKEFILDGQLFHDTMYHPQLIANSVIDTFKEFATPAK